jgi:hypothetical protein
MACPTLASGQASGTAAQRATRNLALKVML